MACSDSWLLPFFSEIGAIPKSRIQSISDYASRHNVDVGVAAIELDFVTQDGLSEVVALWRETHPAQTRTAT